MENETIETNLAEEPKVRSNKNLFVVGLILLVVAALAISFMNKPAEQAALEGCGPEDKFSQTTGEPCSEDASQAVGTPCQEGDVYNIVTGEPCAEE